MSEHKTVKLPDWVVRVGQLQNEYDKVKGITFFAEFPDFLFCKLSNAESALAAKDEQIRVLRDKVRSEINVFQDIYSWQDGESRNQLVCDIRDKVDAIFDAALATPEQKEQHNG